MVWFGERLPEAALRLRERGREDAAQGGGDVGTAAQHRASSPEQAQGLPERGAGDRLGPPLRLAQCRLAHQAGQRAAAPLPRHLDQAGGRHAEHVDRHAVRLEGAPDGFHDLAAVCLVPHRDEIDDHQPSYVSQHHLAGRLFGRRPIERQNRILGCPAGARTRHIHVDRRQRFQLVEHQAAAARKVDPPGERLSDLVRDRRILE